MASTTRVCNAALAPVARTLNTAACAAGTALRTVRRVFASSTRVSSGWALSPSLAMSAALTDFTSFASAFASQRTASGSAAAATRPFGEVSSDFSAAESGALAAGLPFDAVARALSMETFSASTDAGRAASEMTSLAAPSGLPAPSRSVSAVTSGVSCARLPLLNAASRNSSGALPAMTMNAALDQLSSSEGYAATSAAAVVASTSCAARALSASRRTRAFASCTSLSAVALLLGAVAAAATRTAFLRMAASLSLAAAVSVAASSWPLRLKA